MRGRIKSLQALLLNLVLLGSVSHPAVAARQEQMANAVTGKDLLRSEHLAAPVQGCKGNPDVPACGWVPAGEIKGGCRNPRECESDVGPKIAGLFEYVPDRQPVERVPSNGNTPWIPDHEGKPEYPTAVKRQQCYIIPPGGGAVATQWSAGVWHHGAHWDRINGKWYDSGHHWAFYHDDHCDRPVGPPGEPTPAGGPRARLPTATPAPPPADGAVRITVWECQQGLGGLSSAINVWAGDWRDSGSGSSVEFTVPGEHRRVGWSVILPLGWSASSTGGEAGVGASVNVVATSTSCFGAVDPRTPLPTPDIQPCAGSHGAKGSHIAVSVPGAGSQTFGNTQGFDRYGLPLDPWSVDAPTVPASTPLRAGFNFRTLVAADFEADHFGQAAVRLLIQDVTTYRNRLLVDTTDDKAWTDGRGLRVTSSTVSGLDFGGSLSFWNLSGGRWRYPTSAPQRGWFIRNTDADWQVSFVPEEGHRYVIASSAAHDSCRPDFAMWSVAVVQAECPSGACPTPLPAPSAQPLPTPLPPPQPPAAQGNLSLLMHSRHDPNHGGYAARDGVYRSTGTTVAWPQGEILDFAPDVTLQPLPAPPIDPFYGSRYTFQQQIVGWSFVTQAQCRGAGKHMEPMQGCAYEYVPDPTEAQIGNQARAMWAAGNSAPAPTDVYAATMAGLRPVDLPLEVLVETRTLDGSGNILLRRSTTLPATFRIELVAPRSVR